MVYLVKDLKRLPGRLKSSLSPGPPSSVSSSSVSGALSSGLTDAMNIADASGSGNGAGYGGGVAIPSRAPNRPWEDARGASGAYEGSQASGSSTSAEYGQNEPIDEVPPLRVAPHFAFVDADMMLRTQDSKKHLAKLFGSDKEAQDRAVQDMDTIKTKRNASGAGTTTKSRYKKRSVSLAFSLPFSRSSGHALMGNIAEGYSSRAMPFV